MPGRRLRLRCLPPLAALLLAAPVASRAATPFAFDIAPRGFDEHCLRLEAGEAIRWRFMAPAAVEFNIHHHRGEQVFYPVRRPAAKRASGSFRAKASDDYCLMWTNPASTPVSVRGAVERRP